VTARASPHAGPTCRRAFQRMARLCLTAVRQHRAAAGRGDPDAIHQTRIALTKLRAAQKFFAAMTRDTVWPKLKAEIRWLNSALGAARDNDVTTAYAKAQRGKPVAVKRGKRLATEAGQTRRRVAAAMRSKRYDRLIADLRQWIDRGPWRTTDAAPIARRREQMLIDYAPDRLRRWKRRLVSRSEKSMARGRRLHRLRIAAKRYRYMREALNAIGLPESPKAMREREAAQSVQAALGELRDLQRFRRVLSESLPSDLYRRQKKRLLHKAAREFERLG
jgi:CHAD domain-containing protein